jgi:AraC-like DNA-binding protein
VLACGVQVATLHEFLVAPVGRWTHVAPLLLWVATPRLCGITYTGHVASADLPRLRELGDLPLHRALKRPYRAIVDGGELAGIDAAAFTFLIEHVRGLATQTRLAERVACVRPAGMTGAAAIGLFHEYMAKRTDMHFVDDLATAITIVDAEAHRDELLELQEIARGSGLIAVLRGLLREDPRLSLTVVARRLGVSTRTLQRTCTTAGSSYRDEVANARFSYAEALFRSTRDKLDVIARRAGYASATSFARRFQQTYGITPTQFRKRST